MRPKVYISGPLTSSGNPRENMAHAVTIFHILRTAGYAPLCPHLTWHIDPDADIAHDVWMEIDKPWVIASDAVWRFPGESKGADIEVETANEAGVPAVSNLAELKERVPCQ